MESTTILLEYAGAALAGAVALIAAWRQPRRLAGWLFVAGLILLAMESLCFGWVAASDNETIVGRTAAGYWENWVLRLECLLPGVWLLFSLCYARGNSREFLSRWRWVAAGAFAVPVAAAVVSRTWLHERLVIATLTFASGEEMLFVLTTAGWIVCLISLLAAVFVLMQMERTLLASVGTLRWRIKFMVMGLGVLFAARVYTSSQALLTTVNVPHDGVVEPMTGPQTSTGLVCACALILACPLFLRALFREDSEAVVYPPLTGLHKSVTFVVSGVYLLIIGVFAKVVQALGAPKLFGLKALFILLTVVAVATALLSDRVRLHGRRFVSRYLRRPVYDYRTVWRKFAEETASCVTGPELCQASVKLTAGIFQALSVSIWLADDQRESVDLAASTSLSVEAARKLAPNRQESADLISQLQTKQDPFDLEYASEDWAAVLRRCHPSEFPEGGGRACVPMWARGELLGLMILGDRVGGALFSLEDYDLLRCLGDQVAAGLLNLRLSQRLLQSKELEAFQTMSAFFVHDLKNTASTLGLMLQNLPEHFDNPAFREDALRGMAKSAQHLNNLISRLGALRHDLQVRPEEADLNEVVTQVLERWQGAKKVRLVKNFGSLPKVPLDREQIDKVVTNLVINAAEAAVRDPEIRVSTRLLPGWAILTVSDNGCGMSPEFVRRSLFRPFQTTKKEGFGIGMFQSKMIVEAHGGRIEVESAPEEGATFRVLLPVKSK